MNGAEIENFSFYQSLSLLVEMIFLEVWLQIFAV